MTKEEILWNVANGRMSVEIAGALLEPKQASMERLEQQIHYIDFDLKIYRWEDARETLGGGDVDYSPRPVLECRQRFSRVDDEFLNQNADELENIFFGPKGISLGYSMGAELRLPGMLGDKVHPMFASQSVDLSFVPASDSDQDDDDDDDYDD